MLLIAVVLFCATMVAATWTAVGYLIQHERAVRLAEVKQGNESLVRLLEEHTVRTLANVDELTLLIKERFEREGEGLDVPGLFKSLQVPRALIRNAVISDAAGYVVLGSNGAPKTFLGDREHVRVHMERDTGQLFISRPVLARVNGQWSVVATRRANNPDGSLLGVVGVAMDPDYFSDLYKDVGLGKDGVVALVGTDGFIRARLASGDDRGIGADVRGGQLFRQMTSTTQGTQVAAGVTDGVERVYAFRLVRGYPLFVTVGTALAVAMEPVHAQQWTYQSFAAFATILLLLGTAITIWLLRKRHRAEAAIDAYHEALQVKALQLEVAHKEAEAGSRAKSQFLATMSHEIRTPMNGVMGMLQLLQTTPLNARQAQFAQNALESASALMRVLNDVLDLSRADAGAIALVLAPFDPRAPVRDLEPIFRDMAHAKGLAFLVQFDSDLPEAVLGDAGRVRQVLTNLISNAQKFTATGSIEVRVGEGGPRDHDSVRYEVADTGIGMSEASLQRLFTAFWQADPSMSRTVGGTGLGLAICKQMVELMGGRIGADSVQGHGSTLWFEIPVQRPL